MIFEIQKCSSGARSDDTKSLKGAVLDWITPKGDALIPPLSRNIKHDRGFHHERTGFLLCPIGKDWDNLEWGRSYTLFSMHDDCCNCRTKEKLRSGELEVSGDQWPMFLYKDYRFDPNNPWNGLFCSQLLINISASLLTRRPPNPSFRPINMSSRLPAQWRRRPRPLALETLVCMVCLK